MEKILERDEYERNLEYVKKYISGTGLDMGCGRCPLLVENCLHIDHSVQPLAVEQVGEDNFKKADAVSFRSDSEVDYIFSSHMVEDLESKEAITACLNGWADMLKTGGHIVLFLPDMQGGRYPTVEDGGNCSHRVNVGKEFIEEIMPNLRYLELVQIDTIPHDSTCTIDVVFRKYEVMHHAV